MIQPSDQDGGSGQPEPSNEIEIPFPGGVVRPKPKYRCTRDIILLDWEPKTMQGGIIIPEKSQKAMQLSFYSIPVIAAGPECKVVKSGDNVLLPAEAILRVPYDGHVAYFCNEHKVLAVVD